MSERRKDSKGRILHTGERERSNGKYEYRYKDNDGKIRSIYGKDLKILRAKEKEVQKQLSNDIVVGLGDITVLEMFDRMRATRVLRDSSEAVYKCTREYLARSNLANKKIKNVKESDVKLFLIEYAKKRQRRTVQGMFIRLKMTFDLAVRENRISRSPIQFKASEIKCKEEKPKDKIITEEEFNLFIEYVSGLNCIDTYYIPHIIFLKETGLRVSEFCGLSLDDIDFENHTLFVKRQLLYNGQEKTIKISPLKTKCSKGKVWLSPTAISAIKQIAKTSGSLTLDGVDNLFITTEKDKNRLAKKDTIEKALKRLTEKFNEAYPESPIHITPHTLRHMCISKIINNGGSITSAQFQARHSTPNITLSVYTHSKYESVAKELEGLFGEAE